jgi:phosphoribosylanthranilate isomerase
MMDLSGRVAVMAIKVKICGLSSEASLDVALAHGADYVGLVYFPASPRNIALDLAQGLAARARGRAKIVALLVDPDDAQVEAAVASAAPDLLQLHGAETRQRVAEIRRRWGVPVMKAVAVEAGHDVGRALDYAGAADLILFDARAPADSTRPGGNGAPFDWRVLSGIGADVPYVLSGGLTPANVAEAIRVTGARAVDVSSGVEIRPGEKDPDLIRRFIRAAKGV